jgi:uncharacterized protein (TIGR03083 family)
MLRVVTSVSKLRQRTLPVLGALPAVELPELHARESELILGTNGSGRMNVLEPPQPIIVVELFPEILGELLDLLSSLSGEDWQKATACPDWTVTDVALHLLGVEVGNLSLRRDGHALDASITGWDELVIFINDWNRGWIQAARRMSPRLLIDLLQLTGIQICEYFQSLAPHALGGPVSWVGPEPAPVWLDLAREYTERWHHQQHIRDAVGRPGLKQPRYFAPVLGTLAWALPRTYRSVRAPLNTSVALTIPGESGGQWSVKREEEEWRLYTGAPAQPDAEVTIGEDAAWRLFTRGLDPGVAWDQIAVNGNRELGCIVLEMVSIIS